MQSVNKFQIGFGLLTVALGAMPFLAILGILPSRPPQPGDAPAWLGFAIGLAFVLAGIMVIVRSFAGADDGSSELPETASRGFRAFYDLLVMPIPVLLALILSWVAFGPGERHFSMSMGSGGTGVTMGAGAELPGRVMFGCGAVLAWIIVAFMIRSLARRWLRPEPPL